MKTEDKLLIRALNGETLATPPVWLMRQAGRYLPEYRATREKAGGFLNLCYTPDYAVEVTLQPIRRFGFDASILFSDILVIPHAMGRDVWFETGEGPRLNPLEDAEPIPALELESFHAHLAPVYETVGRLREELPKETTLIGFSGAPWTLATYMIAGRGKDEQAAARRLMFSNPDRFSALIDVLADAVSHYLIRQIDSGAEAVQIFDSWASALAPNSPSRLSTPCARHIPIRRLSDFREVSGLNIRISLRKRVLTGLALIKRSRRNGPPKQFSLIVPFKAIWNPCIWSQAAMQCWQILIGFWRRCQVAHMSSIWATGLPQTQIQQMLMRF